MIYMYAHRGNLQAKIMDKKDPRLHSPRGLVQNGIIRGHKARNPENRRNEKLGENSDDLSSDEDSQYCLILFIHSHRGNVQSDLQ